MIGEGVANGIFEFVKPYVNSRRLFFSVLLTILLSDNSFEQLLEMDYSELNVKEGLGFSKEILLGSRFDLAVFFFSLCLYVGPHLNYWIFKICVFLNNKTNFMDKVFAEAEYADISKETLIIKKDKFLKLSKRINNLLESLLFCFFALACEFFTSNTNLYMIFPAFGIVLFLYYESASKIMRDYAQSIYLMRLKYKNQSD
ncbi:hypothetical protein ACUN8C_10515 [Kushneria sp. Sum13]|uniref:hypothetical protein n=1 Tax=Kushneria sp. Sum13 TaxID=3459196 RepID=UPI004045B327